MGLNEDVMVDIDPGVEPFPLPKAEDMKRVSFKVTDSVIDETRSKEALTDMFSNDVKLGELPNLDAQFKVCVDGVSDVLSMKDIEDDILSEQTINQESAKVIDSIVGGFLGDRFSIEEFSVAGSKTNYSESLKFIQDSINTKEDKVGRELIEFYKSVEKVARETRVFMESVVIPFVEKTSDELLPKYNVLMSNGAGAVNAVFPMKDGSFQNVLITKLNSLDMELVDFDNIDDFFGMDKEVFKSLFVNVQDSLKSATLISYIDAVTKEAECLIPSVNAMLASACESFSVNELLFFFNEFFKRGHRLNEIVECLKNAETFYGNQSNVLDDRYQPAVEFVACNANKLIEKNTTISYAHSLSLSLSVFLPLVTKLFLVVDKLET